MEYIGELVKHKTFGLGKIVEFKDTFIIVKFEDGSEKDFVFPDAFDLYLELSNQELLKIVEDKLILIRKKEADRKLIEEEIRKESIRLEQLMAEAEKVKKSVVKKIDSNIVLKCNYCDGGNNSESIGCKDVCSDETMRYNICVAKNKVCSSDNSSCYQYLQGNISKTELDSEKTVCQESKVLNKWRSKPDIAFKEGSGAKAKKLKNVNAGSLVMLSTVLPYEKEKDRVIFAVYLLKANYEMEYLKTGYLVADDKYKIELSLEEAKQLKFWEYYSNAKNPDKITNNSGLNRYFSDIQAAQALRTITEIKKNTKDEALAIEMLDRYCKMKNIDINDLSEQNGALKLQKSS